MTLIRNEQTKLLATFINGIAIAVFAVGALAPVFSSLYSLSGPTALHGVMSFICVLASCVLHLIGRRVLKRLEP